ncbi:hypothetical protein B0H11DRAFT_1932111 [Mycena galericulata]|nr:hypothetical protein B0H11DRAFT_1932111 [Mycena galericulata]
MKSTTKKHRAEVKRPKRPHLSRDLAAIVITTGRVTRGGSRVRVTAGTGTGRLSPTRLDPYDPWPTRGPTVASAKNQLDLVRTGQDPICSIAAITYVVNSHRTELKDVVRMMNRGKRFRLQFQRHSTKSQPSSRRPESPYQGPRQLSQFIGMADWQHQNSGTGVLQLLKGFVDDEDTVAVSKMPALEELSRKGKEKTVITV